MKRKPKTREEAAEGRLQGMLGGMLGLLMKSGQEWREIDERYRRMREDAERKRRKGR